MATSPLRPDQELCRGIDRTFTPFYSDYHDPMARFIKRKFGIDPQTTEDILADTFLNAYQRWGSYQKRPGIPTSAWFYTIARNKARDHLRVEGRKKEIPLSTGETAQGDDNPTYEKPTNPNQNITGFSNLHGRRWDSSIASDEQIARKDQLIQALQKVTKEQRQVIVFRFVDGLPTAEVAEIINKSNAATKKLQKRGLASLRAVLAFAQEPSTENDEKPPQKSGVVINSIPRRERRRVPNWTYHPGLATKQRLTTID